MGALPREEQRASLEGSLMRAVEGSLATPSKYRERKDGRAAWRSPVLAQRAVEDSPRPG